MDGLSTSKLFTTSNLNRLVKEKVSDIAPVLDEDTSQSWKKIRFSPNIITSLIAGASAGFVVDISLFPLDTLKTRLQSKEGFKASGGFRGVYKGMGPTLFGSAPTSAIFFSSYNSIINFMKNEFKTMSDSWIHFTAASLAETMSATVRVPLEVLKQRKQIAHEKRTSLGILKQTWCVEGIGGLYRGFASTLAREIPFAGIQFSLWEYFKTIITVKKNRPVTAFETAYCGAAAGGISAGVTTPMDVIKTRTILASNETSMKYGRLMSFYIARDVFRERGLIGFFAGVVPRVMWITFGGFIYFGVYEFIKQICEKQAFLDFSEAHTFYVLLKELERKKSIMAQSSPSYEDGGYDDDNDYDYDYVEEDVEIVPKETSKVCWDMTVPYT